MPFAMKRNPRLHSPIVCIMPRKALAWMMIVMATLTILSFLLIEVRRILWRKAHLNRKAPPPISQSLKLSNQNKLNMSLDFTSNTRSTDPKKSMEANYSAGWNYEMVEDLLSNEPACPNTVFFLVLVTSSPENFEQRDSIRKTWGDVKDTWMGESPQTKVIFLVGQSTNKFLNILVNSENDMHGDVLKGNYYDTYRNLTLKVVQGLSWAWDHCRPSYVLKTDDDCFANLPLIREFLARHNTVETGLYAGKIRWSAPVVRDIKSRWYVSTSDFSGSRFAPYANGAGYVMSRDVLGVFTAYAHDVRAFPNEDAYVGHVMHVAGVRATYSARFVSGSSGWQTCNFLYLFVLHHVPPARQKELWGEAERARAVCPQEDMSTDWV